MNVLAVTSCERLLARADGRWDRVSYLADTIAALDREGARECEFRMVVADGYQPEVPPGWLVDASRDRLGVRATFWRAFRLAADMGAERLLFFEDDVLPVRNLVRAAVRAPIPAGYAFLDLFDVKELPEATTQPGIYRTPVLGRDWAGFMCCQGMVMAGAAVAWLAGQDPIGVVLPWTGPRRGGDTVLGRLLNRSPFPFYGATLPCMVEHVGRVSAVNPRHETLDERPQPTHRAAPDFDAATFDWTRVIE